MVAVYTLVFLAVIVIGAAIVADAAAAAAVAAAARVNDVYFHSFFIWALSLVDASFFFSLSALLVHCFASLEFVFSYTTRMHSHVALCEVFHKAVEKPKKQQQNEMKAKKNDDYYGVLCDYELELHAVKFDHYIIILYDLRTYLIVVISREKANDIYIKCWLVNQHQN